MQRKRTLMHSIVRVRRIWNDYVRKIALAEEIPDSYRPVIMFLHKNPGFSQRSIAEFTGVTTSAINQVVKNMVEEGYLLKQPEPSDKRSYRLYLTEKGEKLAQRLRAKLEEADEAVTAFTGAGQEEKIIEFLDQLAEFIREELE